MASAIMVIINILQALLINHLHSLAWILAVPLAVFVVLVALIELRLAISHKDILTAWQAADGTKRAAWAGVVLSVLLPIIVCQYIYMPLVALPAWHTTTWATSLRVVKPPKQPSIVFRPPESYSLSAVNFSMSIESITCWYATDTYHTCDVSAGPEWESLKRGDWEYLLMSPRATEQPGERTDEITYAVKDVSLNVRLVYTVTNSTNSVFEPEAFANVVPVVPVAIFDPTFPFNITDFTNACGNPPYYHQVYPSFGKWRQNFGTISTYLVEDPVGALSEDDFAECSTEALQTRNYTYYDSKLNLQLPTNAEDCPVGDGTACAFVLSLHIESSLVTTQRSSRGTNALRILTDEGSLVGGISFLTWFLGIFVL